MLCEDGIGRDPGCQIRANLAFALGRLQYHPASDVLRAGIRTVQIEPVGGVPFDTAAHLRANCALALAQLRDVDCVRDIALLLFDRSGYALRGVGPDPTLKMEPRKAAARALALTGSVQARLPLTLKLVHPENEAPEVLQECMQALVDLEDPHALEVLEPYLSTTDARLAAYAALMIARTQAPEAAALLGEAMQRLSGDPLRATVLALTTLRTPEAYALLHGWRGRSASKSGWRWSARCRRTRRAGQCWKNWRPVTPRHGCGRRRRMLCGYNVVYQWIGCWPSLTK